MNCNPLSIRCVGVLALAFLFTFSTNVFAQGMTFDVDSDVDGVPDSVDQCTESAPVGTDSGLIDPNTGCFRTAEACVAWRSANGGNGLDCAGTPRWSGEYLEVMRGVSMRQRSDGTLISVSGNSVSRRGDALVCSESSSYLYADGKGQAPGGEVFDSSIGKNQLPFCSSHRYESTQVVAAARSGVSQSEVDETVSRATSGWNAQLSGVEGRLDGVESMAGEASSEAARAHTRLNTVEGHFAPGGRVAKLEAHFSNDENSFASRTAAAIARTLGIAQEAHRLATDARRTRFSVRGGATFSTLNIVDGKVHRSQFTRNIDPFAGWRVISVGVVSIPHDRFYFDIAAHLDLFFMKGEELAEVAAGVGLGGQVTFGGVVTQKPGFLGIIGGGLELELRLHNVGMDMMALSETFSATPRGGVVLVCGKDRRFITSLMAGPGGHGINWSDGTKLWTGVPTAEVDFEFGVLF